MLCSGECTPNTYYGDHDENALHTARVVNSQRIDRGYEAVQYQRDACGFVPACVAWQRYFIRLVSISRIAEAPDAGMSVGLSVASR